MPPQNNPAPAPAPAPSMPPSSGQAFNPDSLTKNPKFITTIKTFAIYAPILMVVNFVVNIVVSGFKYGSFMDFFVIPALIMAVITGVIGGAIGGAIFYFLYDPIHNWVKGVSFLSKYIHNMFTLFWIPSLVFSIIGGVFGLLGLMSLTAALGAYGVASMGGAFVGVIISFVVNLVIYYFYAKAISAKLEPMYPW